MSAIVKTNTTLFDVNHVDNNNTFIYVARKNNATDLWIDWKDKYQIHWEKYQIKETDMRQKTATFTSPTYLDLTTGQYCVLITSPFHEDFGGVIMKVEYDKKNQLYSYQCQDFSRNYQTKFELISNKIKLHRILQYLITRGGYSLKGKITNKTKKKYKKVLSGLRPAYQYDQEFYGSTIRFNPMTNIQKIIIRNQSVIEVIRNLVIGSGAYIDVYFDKYGIIHIEPYHKNDLFNTGLYLTTPEIAEAKYKFDTTNIITGVAVQSTNKNKIGKVYSSSSLFNLDLSVFFGKQTTSISNPNQSTASTSTSNKTSKSASSKKSNTSKKTSNPYGTKKKEVWFSMDEAGSVSADNTFLKNIAKELKKHGWKAHNMGRSREAHHRNRNKAKNGIWWMIFNGVDPGTLRYANDQWFRTPLVNNNSRMVIGFHKNACDIRKGGKCYKRIGKAWDDHYSSRDTSIKYPADYLTRHGVPFMYTKGYDYKTLVSKFVAGGDNPSACNKNWKTKGTGYYKD